MLPRIFQPLSICWPPPDRDAGHSRSFPFTHWLFALLVTFGWSAGAQGQTPSRPPLGLADSAARPPAFGVKSCGPIREMRPAQPLPGDRISIWFDAVPTIGPQPTIDSESSTAPGLVTMPSLRLEVAGRSLDIQPEALGWEPGRARLDLILPGPDREMPATALLRLVCKGEPGEPWPLEMPPLTVTTDTPQAIARRQGAQLFAAGEGQPFELRALGRARDGAATVAAAADLDGDGIFEQSLERDPSSGFFTASVTFREDGIRSVGLQVTDERDRSATLEVPVLVGDRRPGTSLTLDPPQPRAGEPVTGRLTVFEPGADRVAVAVASSAQQDPPTFVAHLPADEEVHELSLDPMVFDTPGDHRISVQLSGDDGTIEEQGFPVTIRPALRPLPFEAAFADPVVVAGDSLSLRLTAAGKLPVDRFVLEMEAAEGALFELSELQAATDQGDAWTVAVETLPEERRRLTLKATAEAGPLTAGQSLSFTAAPSGLSDQTLSVWAVQAFLQGFLLADEPLTLPFVFLLEAEVGCRIGLFPTPRRWLPEPGKTVQHLAVVIQFPRRGLPQQLIAFGLSNISNEPGTALNQPLKNPGTDADLRIVAGDQVDPNIQVTAATGAATLRPTTFARVVTRAEDYGAFGTLTALSCGSSQSRKIPLDRLPAPAGNGIADAWDQANPGDLAAMADVDPLPRGKGIVGDGLSRYEEYRGFFVAGTHTRTSPAKKDVFVEDANNLGLGTFSALGYEGQLIRSNESDESLEINFNSKTAHVYDQKIIQLQDQRIPQANLLGVTMSSLSDGKASICIIDQRKTAAQAFAGRRGAVIDATVGHELGHAVGLKPPPERHNHSYGFRALPLPGPGQRVALTFFGWKACSMHTWPFQTAEGDPRSRPFLFPALPADQPLVPAGFCSVAGRDGYACTAQHAVRTAP